ncbi:transposase [Stenotrophomonas sp. SY1]|nr:transposase [Stenotrophomonas sp. SY1]MCD9087160.1 transposase [Stenotrophomonas sp. SY1]
MAPATNNPNKGHQALRRGRVSLVGQVYLITFSTECRLPAFTDPLHAAAACRAICDPRLWQNAGLLTWVLMPDHWHGLIQLGCRDALAATVRNLKSNSARVLPTTVTRPVWARGYHDRALRREDCLRAVSRYIVMNPVRAGLAASPRDYPYWNTICL